MQRFIKSVLVIILTLITIIAMNTFSRSDNNTAAVNMDNEQQTSSQTNEDTGYIFDTGDQNINIKLNDAK